MGSNAPTTIFDARRSAWDCRRKIFAVLQIRRR
jgi:hypothetical protein